jgi:hypothetical protein
MVVTPCVYRCVYMARVNVYMPDSLADAVRAAGMNLSNITQVAAERELARMRVSPWLARVLFGWSMDVSPEATLEALRITRGSQNELADEG